jgi:NAD(P)-dependent dehydrogenase (short-subunit alcohol dehydrogenase family)
MEQNMDFDKQVVVLTGAAGHLGRAVAHHFATRGASLVLIDVDRARLLQAHGDTSERQMLAPADLRDTAQAAATVQAALHRFGGIDVLVNVAGGFRMGETVHETSDETWNLLFDLNTRTLLNMCRAVVPVMRSAGRGRIVNVGAYGALRGGALMGAYAASKSSVIRLTEAMAAELREHSIGVNCVLPTIIDSPDNRAAMPDADPSRWVAPEALAEVISFLASDAARAMHGAAVPVTGLV